MKQRIIRWLLRQLQDELSPEFKIREPSGTLGAITGSAEPTKALTFKDDLAAEADLKKKAYYGKIDEWLGFNGSSGPFTEN